MTSTRAFRLTLFSLLVLFLPAEAGAEQERPNILFAFADDWGCYASAYAKLDKQPSANDVVHTPHFARGHELHQLEHIHVREVMIREFPTVRRSDDAREIIRIARANSHIECLTVMDQDGRLVGIIRPEDLHRVLDSDVPPHLVNAEDIASSFPLSVSPDANLLEALSDFGMRDLETLPVESGEGRSRRLVGLLLRADVMRRYRREILKLS